MFSRKVTASCADWFERGVISACQAAVQSFKGLIIARFFLGFVEAPFFPGAVMLM
jgi:hypothetical protein